MLRCVECNTINSDDSRYCCRCGSNLMLQGASVYFEYENNPFAELENNQNRIVSSPTHSPPKQQINKGQAPDTTRQTASSYTQSYKAKTNNTVDNTCLVGFVFSVISIFCCGFTAVIGLIVSIVGFNSVSKNGKPGKNYAIAGIVISGVMLFVFIMSMISSAIQPDFGRDSKNTRRTNRIESNDSSSRRNRED